MNQIIEFLNSHVSERHFTDKQISADDEYTIISTAQRSATSSNIQAYSIIGIRNQDKKNELSVLAGNQEHVAASSLFLVFCADLYRLKFVSDSKGYNFDAQMTERLIISTVDTALAASRALEAAQALGIGGVMVGGIRNNPDKVSDLLKLPELVYPVMGMSLGYPEKKSKIKPRLGIDAIYHKEEYSDKNYDNLIAAYDAVIDDVGYLKGREVMAEKFPDFKGLYSWSEHTARRLTNKARPHMRAFLESKGFMKE